MGTFTDVMRAECAKRDAKPVCDHHSFCESDARSAYLGQGLAYLSLGSDRAFLESYFTGGAPFSSHWGNGTCYYTNGDKDPLTLCDNGDGVSHSWRHVGQVPWSFP